MACEPYAEDHLAERSSPSETMTGKRHVAGSGAAAEGAGRGGGRPARTAQGQEELPPPESHRRRGQRESG